MGKFESWWLETVQAVPKAARETTPEKPDMAEMSTNLDKLQLGMDEVDLANKLKDGEKHHANGMKLLKEVREWLLWLKAGSL